MKSAIFSLDKKYTHTCTPTQYLDSDGNNKVLNQQSNHDLLCNLPLHGSNKQTQYVK